MTCLHAELPIVLHLSSKPGTCTFNLTNQGSQALGHCCPHVHAARSIYCVCHALFSSQLHVECDFSFHCSLRTKDAVVIVTNDGMKIVWV